MVVHIYHVLSLNIINIIFIYIYILYTYIIIYHILFLKENDHPPEHGNNRTSNHGISVSVPASLDIPIYHHLTT